MTITRRLKQAVYLACLRKPQSARQILEKVNKVIKDASYEDVSSHAMFLCLLASAEHWNLGASE